MPVISRRAFLAGALCLPALPAVHAREAPLRIVYPYPAGGSADAIARLIAEHLRKSLDRPVLVENKTGASGLIGAQTVRNAPADGSTILLAANSQFTIQPHTLKTLGYDPFADFVPISQI